MMDANNEDHTRLSKFDTQKLQNLGLDALRTADPVTIEDWSSDGSPAPALTRRLFGLLQGHGALRFSSLDPETLEKVFED